MSTPLQKRLTRAGIIGLAILVPGGIVMLLFIAILGFGRARTLARSLTTLRAA